MIKLSYENAFNLGKANILSFGRWLSKPAFSLSHPLSLKVE